MSIKLTRQFLDFEQPIKELYEQIDQTMETVRKSFMIIVIFSVLFGSLIAGSIASLIGAAVAKKKPINPLDQLPS